MKPSSEEDGPFDSANFDVEAAERPLPLTEVLQVMAEKDLTFDEGRFHMVLTRMAQMGVDASGMPVDSKLVTFGGKSTNAEVDSISKDHSPRALPKSRFKLPSSPKESRLGMLQVPKTLSFSSKAVFILALMFIIVSLAAVLLWDEAFRYEDAMLGNFMCDPSHWSKWVCRHMTPHVANVLVEDRFTPMSPADKIQV